MATDVPSDRWSLEQVPPLAEKARRTAAAFARRFGESPVWLSAAPGRINVIGEHVDYCEGLVLPMAIDRHVVVAGGRSPEMALHVVSSMTGEEALVPLDQPIERGLPAWSNYVRGVMREFADRGLVSGGLNLFIDSDLPMGGGLSSSAALEVATATLLEAATGHALPPMDKARLCQRAEHTFAGVPCGMMDQLASVHGREGHLLLIDCQTLQLQPVDLRDESVTLFVVNTNVRHNLGDSEYPVRRAHCEEAAQRLGLHSLRDATRAQLDEVWAEWPDPIRRCARHVIGEIARTREAAEALAQGDWDRAGALMFSSHDSLRDDFRVSCPELDLVVKLARELGTAGGIYGCRMTGGGFGGCCVALIRSELALAIGRSLGEGYAAETGVRPTMFMSRPSAGAGLLQLPSDASEP